MKNKLLYLLVIPVLIYACTPKTAPKISLSNIEEIGFNSAEISAEIVSNGEDSVLYKGICWSKKPGPKDSIDFSKREDNGLGTIQFTIDNLDPGTTYFVRAYAKNSVGISYSEEKSFSTPNLEIGSDYQGGKVGYLFERGDNGYVEGEMHGLIIGDVSTNWYNWNGGSDESGTYFNNGLSNSQKIADLYPNTPAAWCINLELNGFDDWYLPSMEELLKIYPNKRKLGINDYTLGFTYHNIGSIKQKTNRQTRLWSSSVSEYKSESTWFDVSTLLVPGTGRCNGEPCINDFISEPMLRCHWWFLPLLPNQTRIDSDSLILPVRSF
jgi:hypothetical protein